MCGIGGYFLKPNGKIPRGFMDNLEEGLRHRGPDGSRRASYGSAGFVHTRLAIIDVAGGGQPFIKDGGDFMAMANGEIYNHGDLRQSLSDVAFTSNSDCEVLLPLWQAYGEEFSRKLRGMYAVALYDTARDRGCLSRDAFGIKPLYYFEDARGIFFASEIATLKTALGLSLTPDRLAAASILDRQFVIDGKTPFDGIHKLRPGETLTIDNGRITSRFYDKPLYDGPLYDGPLVDEAADTFESPEQDLNTLLASTVEVHQLSDVPFGLFLSGGVDSSALLALMAQLRLAGKTPEHTPQLLTYTAHFDDDSVANEMKLAKHLAGLVGAEFIDVKCTKADFFNHMGKMVAATDDPVADYAALPTYLLARRADVKVVLTGEGGDEFFAGYGRYRRGLRWLRPRRANRPGPAIKSGILKGDLSHRLSAALAAQDTQLPNGWERMTNKNDALRMLQAYDIEGWLPDDLLTKIDRCLMAHGVEGRVPFVDRHLSRAAFNLNARDKIRHKQGKYILKSWLDDVMPQAQAFNRKRGFGVPVGRWMVGESAKLARLASGVEGLREVVNTDLLEGLFGAADGRAGLLAWRVLYYGLWYQIHVKGVAPEQPIDAILAQT